MGAFLDLSGKQFGRLKVICEAAERTSSGGIRWLCRCDCSNEVFVPSTALVTGNTISCGCVQKERTGASNTIRAKHGHARKGPRNTRLTSPEYRSWKAMLERVRNPNAPNFHHYGGRGVTVCDRWLGPFGFVNFFADMGHRPEGKTIDRIDVDGDYEPDNCRWATAKEQAQNRRSRREVAFAG